MENKGYSIGDYFLIVSIPIFRLIYLITNILYCLIIILIHGLIHFKLPKTISINIKLPYNRKKGDK
jgi:hypothetical protein